MTPDKIKALRKKHNVTQAHCAKILHMHKHGFQKYEYGLRKMHPAFWDLLELKLAQRLGGLNAAKNRETEES